MTPSEVFDGFTDLDIDIEVQVDHRPLTLRQILELDNNSVVKLPRSAGENMDVFIGGSLVCHGEIVVTDERVGIRITDFREED